MRRLRTLALLAVVLALAGCGATPQQEVEAKLSEFVHAVATRDARSLCHDVLAPALVRKLATLGLGCRQAMAEFTSGVSNPTLSIAKVSVYGRTATAVVLSGASGQSEAVEAVNLVQTSSGWRISSLGTPH